VAFGINDDLIVAPATTPSASIAPATISVLPWRVWARVAKDRWGIASPARKRPVSRENHSGDRIIFLGEKWQ